jgi:hypothetical protein
VRAAAPDPDTLSAFAALRTSDAALTVMIVHKRLSGSAALTLDFSNFAAGGSARVWQLTSANTIAHLADVAVAAGALATTLPAQSVTLFVIPAAGLTATDVAPSSGPASGGTAVKVSGAGFLPGAVLSFGGAAASGAVATSAHRIDASTGPRVPGAADAVVTNPGGGSTTLPRAFFYDFHDVPGSFLFHDPVVAIARAGITAGCGGGNYCPNLPVTRAEMAIFVLRGKHGSSYHPPAATGTRFADVQAGAFAADWIEQFAAEGITAGCGGGNYCPGNAVTRGEMAVFLLRGRNGSAFAPAPAEGGLLADVTVSTPFARWIERLALEGITLGCGGGSFCPAAPVTRGEMAPFLVRAFAP